MTSNSSMNRIARTMSKVIKLYHNKSRQLDREQVEMARDLINKGGVIAVPTDTIYGIAAKVDDPNALNKIYKIKGRDPDKPLSICVSSIEDIDEVAETQNLKPSILISLLPGPITILLKRSQKLISELNPGVDTVGVRIPDNKFINALCAFTGPLALTSANRSGEMSPLSIQDFEVLFEELDCVFDFGPLRKYLPDGKEMLTQRFGSTVVDLTRPNIYTIVREGCALNRTINTLNRFGYRRIKAK